MCELAAEGFALAMAFRVFPEDRALPVNTRMEIAVESGEFSGRAALEVDIKALLRFSLALDRLYRTLQGEALLQEPYGARMYLRLTGNGRGQITVEGDLRGMDGAGNAYRLAFSHCLDQTSLAGFCRQLEEACGPYR